MVAGQGKLNSALWSACDELRGTIDLQNSILYLMGLLLIKYLGDRAEVSGDDRTILKTGRWTVPPQAQWQHISADPTGRALITGIQAIESHPDNQELTGVFTALGLPVLAGRAEICSQVLPYFSSLDLLATGEEELATAVDSLLQRWVESAGLRGGEYSTPPDLSCLLAELLSPGSGTEIYDPACGTGSLLVAAWRRSVQQPSDAPPCLYGQDIAPQIAALAKAYMILNGVMTSSVATGDTLLSPGFLVEAEIRKFDCVISNPPFGARLSQPEAERLEHDPYKRFPQGISGPTADSAFIQHIVASLKDRGRAVLLVSRRVLSAAGREGEIRRALVEADLIEAVISLPGNVFQVASAPPAILILNKGKSPALRGKVLLVYADEEYEVGHPVYRISPQQRQKIVQAVQERGERPRFSAIVSAAQIASNDGLLVPARYIDLAGLDHFLGGAVQWRELVELAEVIQGSRLGRAIQTEGNTAIIRGRDLSTPGISEEELARVEVNEEIRNPVYSECGDVLVQRIGLSPRARLVEEELAGVLVSDTVYVVRLHKDLRHLGRYLVEFLNSNAGQALFSTRVGGVGAPTLTMRDLRHLRVPIPEPVVVSLVGDLHEVEQTLVARVSKARELRRRLFSIEDRERADAQLRSLAAEAQVLAASLGQVDDLDFQIRNFYPFPLAYAYRTLSAIREPGELYRERLRVAENILAFLGLLGLGLSAHTQALSDPGGTAITAASLAGYWRGGISPGDWQSMGHNAGVILLSNRELALVDSYASLWFRGSGRKESEFARATKELVRLKNDFKHDRGPTTTEEYEETSLQLEAALRECLGPLSFLIQHPVRLVQHIDRDWRTKRTIVDTLVYMGDHPGLRQERLTLEDMPSEDKLYLELEGEAWVSLYPLVSVQYCPSCKFRETYFVDLWNGSGERIRLKSFERGHVHDNDAIAQRVGADLAHWLGMQFPATSNTP